MQLIEVPAKAGYVWFRQGIWLFRRNPLAFLTVFFAYLFVMTLISRIPLIGPFLPLLLIPGVAVGFMAACRNTIVGQARLADRPRRRISLLRQRRLAKAAGAGRALYRRDGRDFRAVGAGGRRTFCSA